MTLTPSCGYDTVDRLWTELSVLAGFNGEIPAVKNGEQKSRMTLVVVALLAALLPACGAKEAPITVPAGAQAGNLVGLEWPGLAKLVLSLVVIVSLLLAAVVWFVVRWVRRRRTGRV